MRRSSRSCRHFWHGDGYSCSGPTGESTDRTSQNENKSSFDVPDIVLNTTGQTSVDVGSHYVSLDWPPDHSAQLKGDTNTSWSEIWTDRRNTARKLLEWTFAPDHNDEAARSYNTGYSTISEYQSHLRSRREELREVLYSLNEALSTEKDGDSVWMRRPKLDGDDLQTTVVIAGQREPAPLRQSDIDTAADAVAYLNRTTQLLMLRGCQATTVRPQMTKVAANTSSALSDLASVTKRAGRRLGMSHKDE